MAQDPGESLQSRALRARQDAEDAAARREVEQFVNRRRVGERLVRSVLGVEATDWRPFGMEVATEVDGVFLSTGRSYSGFSTNDVLHFWRSEGEHGNEKLEVRSLAALGRFIERYGSDYRPSTASHFGRSER